VIPAPAEARWAALNEEWCKLMKTNRIEILDDKVDPDLGDEYQQVSIRR